jgi:methyl-accepting chemotaxis protein
MMILLLSASLLSVQQGTEGTVPRAIQIAAELSTIAIAVLAVLVLVVALPLALQLRKLLKSLQQNVQPVSDRARVAAENVEYISAVVREDVQKVRTSVSGLSDRLKEASDRMEERVEEFNALMDVVQDETESVLLDTAAIVRGVRAGAQTMGEGVAGAATAGAPLESTPADPTPLSPTPEEGEDDSETEDQESEAISKGAPDQG